MTVTGSVICPVPAPPGYYSSGLSGGSVLLIMQVTIHVSLILRSRSDMEIYFLTKSETHL